MKNTRQTGHAKAIGKKTSSASWPDFSPVSVLVFLLLTIFAITARAEVAQVERRVPQEQAWIGQRVPVYVDLRTPGSFAGTAHFDLPQLPGVTMLKIGEPVVGTQDIAGETWFLQTHEFALFSQRPGLLEVPAFSVRFGEREGFSGPATDILAQSPGFAVEIQRPPGSEQIGFLITTESLDVTEVWEPSPGPAEVGAVFKRTITQRAPQQSGISLLPAPTTAPDGIRVYPGDVETKDDLYRGQFLGERKETITYLLQQSGSHTLPDLTYVWWNPKTEDLESTTLPSVTFEVAPAPIAAGTAASSTAARLGSGFLAVAMMGGVGIWQRQRIVSWIGHIMHTLNPPHRAAARRLLRACRRSDVTDASRAWMAVRALQETPIEPGPELRAAVLDMQRHLFGPAVTVPWHGDDLARAFGTTLSAAASRSSHGRPSGLPLLNSRIDKMTPPCSAPEKKNIS